ncbi:UDP-glucose 6-dehydrogenase [Halorubrum sp. AJ67]|nr:UDP-glucose 6-dehydrogenase [Halorubrum sp. AJ67]
MLGNHIGVADRQVAVLSLAFKPRTGGIRNTRAIPVIEGLLERDANVVAHDPVAVDNMREQFPDIEYADSAADVLRDAHASPVVTDWNQYEVLDESLTRWSTTRHSTRRPAGSQKSTSRRASNSCVSHTAATNNRTENSSAVSYEVKQIDDRCDGKYDISDSIYLLI